MQILYTCIKITNWQIIRQLENLEMRQTYHIIVLDHTLTWRRFITILLTLTEKYRQTCYNCSSKKWELGKHNRKWMKYLLTYYTLLGSTNPKHRRVYNAVSTPMVFSIIHPHFLGNRMCRQNSGFSTPLTPMLRPGVW